MVRTVIGGIGISNFAASGRALLLMRIEVFG
jgi:hypothetical protein